MDTDTRTAGVVARTVTRWVVRLAVWSLAAVVAVAITVVIILPRATHGFAMTVLTGSMTPEIPVGSVVLVRPVDPATLEIGDVATYRPEQNEDAFITHRVIGIEDKGPSREFVFKGDANDDRDFEPVSSRDVVGEVWFHVPFLGSVRDALHGKAGLSLLAMLVLGGYTLIQVGGAFGDSRRARRELAIPASRVIEVQRTLVLTELRRRPSTTATEAARGWEALVVAETEATYTLLIAPPVDGLNATLELLRGQSPVTLEVWDAPARLSATVTRAPSTHTPVATDTGVTHAS